MLPPELTNTIEQYIAYIHRNEAHFTYIYVNHTNVSEADRIYITRPQMSFLIYSFRSGAPPMTLLTAGALTEPQLPATASNVCTTDTSLGAPPPNKNPGYAGDLGFNFKVLRCLHNACFQQVNQSPPWTTMEINSLGISKKKETQSFQQRTSTNFHQESPMPVGPMTLTNTIACGGLKCCGYSIENNS